METSLEYKVTQTFYLYSLIISLCLMAIRLFYPLRLLFQSGFSSLAFSNLFSVLFFGLTIIAIGLAAKQICKKVSPASTRLQYYRYLRLAAIVLLVYFAFSFFSFVITAIKNGGFQYLIDGLPFLMGQRIVNLEGILLMIMILSGTSALEKGLGAEKIHRRFFLLKLIIWMLLVFYVALLISIYDLWYAIIGGVFILIAMGWMAGTIKSMDGKVIKGAIVGGIIAGPAGAIVGAIASSNGGSNSGNAVKGAVAGAVIAGPAGAVVGAVAAKNKKSGN